MNSTIVIWLLLSIHSPDEVELSKKTFPTRDACQAEQINKHFERPKVEHRCVAIRVFAPVKKGPQQ